VPQNMQSGIRRYNLGTAIQTAQFVVAFKQIVTNYQRTIN
jgi:hypothetical protein